MDANCNLTNSLENSSEGDIRRKNGVSQVTSPPKNTNSEASVPPKDVSQGLQNPVFVVNDEEGLSLSPTSPAPPPSVKLKNDSSQIKSKGFIMVPAFGTPPFTIANPYGTCTSQTTLYHKDDPCLPDAEKGSPEIKSENSSTVKPQGKAEYKGLKKYIGLLLALVGSFCFSIVVLCVKILKDYGFNAYGATFWRYTGIVVPSIPLLLFYECGPGVKKQATVFQSIWPFFENENWKAWAGLLSRGIIGATSVILRYYALQYLSIGETSVITYASPVLVVFLAHCFLGEKCGIFPIIISFTTLVGVVIVIKPGILTGSSDDFDTDKLIGSAFAIGSLICSALIVIITRTIREVHFTVMSLVFGIVGVLQAVVLIYFMGQFNIPTELFDSLLVVGVGALSFVGQMAIIIALKFENAGPVALVRSCDVIFGFLFQYLFLDVVPDAFSAVGAVIVLLGVISIGLRKWLHTLPKEDSRRKTWSFVLK